MRKASKLLFLAPQKSYNTNLHESWSNDTNDSIKFAMIRSMKVSDKVLYPELSYKVTGLLFEVHNSLGRYCREKQYADTLEKMLNEARISFKREKSLPVAEIEDKFTNKADFVINDELLLELKSKAFVTDEDYSQVHRYLDSSGLKLGIIVNFRNKYLRPIRIIRSNS